MPDIGCTIEVNDSAVKIDNKMSIGQWYVLLLLIDEATSQLL